MQLISLTANQPSFKRVDFNPTGITLIMGKSTTKDKGNTYNGVGKSLLLHIISFCLASKKIHAFEEHLPDWEFTLTLRIGNREYRVSRNTSKQSEIYVNNERFALKSLQELLKSLLLDTPEKSAYLTFRSVLSRFYRIGKSSYISSLSTQKEPPFTSLVNNAFLLELDLDLVYRKRDTRVTYTDIEKFQKSFKKDPVIKEYYTGNNDVDLEIVRLTTETKKLKNDIENFNVSKNYAALQNKADALAVRLNKQKNRVSYLQSCMKNIQHSLKLYDDARLDDVYKLYGEMTEMFKEGVLKNIEKVVAFHQGIQANRSSRLQQELNKLTLKKDEEQVLYEQLQEIFDDKMKVLAKSRALDFFAAINTELTGLQARLNKLKDYKNISVHSEKRMAKALSDLASQEIDTTDYLEIYKAECKAVYKGFSELASKFYPNSPAGISIQNNSGNNQERFNITAKIQNDASDGINEVKIFCYDLNNLLNSTVHNIKSLFHDSRLFSDIDPRQRAILLQQAHHLTKSSGCQYIATINEDQLVSLRDVLSKEDFDEIHGTVTLELKDDSPKSKLLGIQVDMQYEKE